MCFPGKPDWVGSLSDISHSLTESKLPVHECTVRIKSDILEPRYGWQGFQSRKRYADQG